MDSKDNDDEPLTTTRMKARVMNYMNTNMKDDRTIRFYEKASFLDPRFKHLYTIVKQELIQEARALQTDGVLIFLSLKICSLTKLQTYL